MKLTHPGDLKGFLDTASILDSKSIQGLKKAVREVKLKIFLRETENETKMGGGWEDIFKEQSAVDPGDDE